MIRAIHQVLPVLVRGDAIGNYTIRLQQLFRSWGVESTIFAGWHSPEAPPGGRHSGELQAAAGPDDIVLLHYGVYCWELQAFLNCQARKVMVYHNITPPGFFVNYSLRHYYVTALGRAQLRDAVRAADLILTPSLYNKGECDALDARDCRVLPLLLDLTELDAVTPASEVVARYRDGRTNVVFVGRLAPNKRQDNVIAAFARYRQRCDPDARLILVGSAGGLEAYQQELEAQVGRLGLGDAVVFTGHISLAELVGYYRVADVFLCLSEHEGFAVPLVEAMHFDVPIVALASAAIPGTLRNAGVLIDTLDYDRIADALERLRRDPAHHAAVLAAQRRRLRDFAPSKLTAMMRLYLEELAA